MDVNPKEYQLPDEEGWDAEPTLREDPFRDFIDEQMETVPEPEDAEVPFADDDGHRESDPLPELDPGVKRAVRRAHANPGHPSRTAFVRVLRLSGAPWDAIEHACLWTSPTCMSCKQPDSPKPARRLELSLCNACQGQEAADNREGLQPFLLEMGWNAPEGMGGSRRGKLGSAELPLNIGMHLTTAGTGWQNGIAERHGGILKTIIHCMLAETKNATVQKI